MNEKRLCQALLAGLMILALPACVNKTPGKPLDVTQNDSQAPAANTKNAAQDDDDGGVGNNHDPFEPVNRGLFEVHEVIDGLILSPVAHIYRGVFPEQVRNSVNNALINLDAPTILLNSVLQGDFTNASRTIERFLVNSTVGIGGLFDVASAMGIPHQHSKDFGQTLGVYGIPQGPYIFIPVLGPSDARDVVGYVGDIFSDPFYYILNNNAYLALDLTRGLNKRSELLPLTDRIHRDSFDVYVTYRSVYQQNREKVVRDYMGQDAALEKESGK